MLEAIYHPNYVPEISWYKSQLLLWDKIYRIVPHSVEKEFGTKGLSKEWNIPECYVPTVDLCMPDYDYFDDRKLSIKRQLEELSKTHLNTFEEDYFFLNIAKIPDWVGDVLNEYQLRKKETYKEWDAEHYLVREDASDFLMSCVAHSMSIGRNTSPLTNKKMCCFATYANQIGRIGSEQPSGENLKSLIAGVFDFMVPGNIDKLSFSDVIDIRNEYNSLREAASDCIKSISDEFGLNNAIIKDRADELLKSALEKFEKEVRKFKRNTWKRVFKNWKVQTLATTLGFVGGYLAGGPDVAVAAASGSGGISILNHIAGRDEPARIAKTIQYFNKINEKIALNEYVEGLLNYRKLVFDY